MLAQPHTCYQMHPKTNHPPHHHECQIRRKFWIQSRSLATEHQGYLVSLTTLFAYTMTYRYKIGEHILNQAKAKDIYKMLLLQKLTLLQRLMPLHLQRVICHVYCKMMAWIDKKKYDCSKIWGPGIQLIGISLSSRPETLGV